MEGIAKTADVPVSLQVSQVCDSVPSMTYDDVSIDILRFFGQELGERLNSNQKDEYKTISKWAFKGVETLGEGMKKLRDLEIRLGSPIGSRDSQTRRAKIYNWVRMQHKIDDMKLRQEALIG